MPGILNMDWGPRKYDGVENIKCYKPDAIKVGHETRGKGTQQ